MKLHAKVQFLVLGMAIAPIVLSALLLFHATRLSQESGEAKEFLELRHWLRQSVMAPLENGDIPEDLADNPPGRAIVVNHSGRVVASTHPEVAPLNEPARPHEMEEIAREMGDVSLVIELVETPSGEEFRVLSARPEIGPPPFRESWRTLGIIAVFGLVLLGGALAGTKIIRDFQNRLRFIHEATHRISSGDLSTPVKVDSNDEVADLAADLDRMRTALLESREARSRLLMGVSHDLGTPLTTILGYVEALEDELFQNEADRKRSLRAIRTKANLLQSRVQELVEFIRFETGERNPRLEEISVAEYLENTCRATDQDMQLSNRDFQWDVEPVGKAVMAADRSLLDRVLENLFHNAMRYTEEGDEIRLTAKPDDKAADRIVIRIDDSGAGFGDMEPEDSFEPFRRGDRSRNQPGFGLGLPTARSILESMGMSITAEHSPLGGAALIIRAPVKWLWERPVR